MDRIGAQPGLRCTEISVIFATGKLKRDFPHLDRQPAPAELANLETAYLLEAAAAEPGTVLWEITNPATGEVKFTALPAQIARLRRAAADIGVRCVPDS